jgi:hypothetical protein
MRIVRSRDRGPTATATAPTTAAARPPSQNPVGVPDSAAKPRRKAETAVSPAAAYPVMRMPLTARVTARSTATAAKASPV